MYRTKPLSLYNDDLSMVREQEGPNSGYLITYSDQDSRKAGRSVCCCCGTIKHLAEIKKPLPFPHNRIVKVVFSEGQKSKEQKHKVWFIPVLDQPLSSNRYYVIRESKRSNRWQACTCSSEEDAYTCCLFCNSKTNSKQRVLDYKNIYQQVEIIEGKNGGFTAKSVVNDGQPPPTFLKKNGWKVFNTKSSYNLPQIGEAWGLDVSLRDRQPKLIHTNTVVVGKWYCPLVFIREGRLMGKYHLMKKNSLFYQMTLEQFWEEIYGCQSDYYTSTSGNSNIVSVSANVQKDSIKLFGQEAMEDYDSIIGETHEDGFVWFKQAHNTSKEEGNKSSSESTLGLSEAIVEKMSWIQEKGGWVRGGGVMSSGEYELVEKEFRGEDGWKKFGCFVLVERFALRRMDGSLVLTWDYKHVHQIQSKWE